ncbi:MAG: hypothetical protein PHG67_04565 [Bacteroidales bacterium]|nr:hypothetical protein [Bacteroidales bacterium]HOI32060.1 hypothetical protein [Bacteroidales bacterium]
MRTPEYKTELIQHLIHMQEAAIDHARKAMDEAQEEANNYGTPKDRYDGFRNQQLRKKDMFAKQMFKAMQYLDLLKKPEINKPQKEVGFGALVQTDSELFFVGVGLGIIQFQEEEVIVISMLVPVYHAMKSKKKGESFSFNNKPYKILQII